MKAKRGQVLILALLALAAGMIVIAPLLYFLDSSSTQYLHESTRTIAYYTTDDVMENILSDIYSGVDVYNQNLNAPYSQSNYLNSGYDVNVSINYATTQSLPAPTGTGDWIYLDPGVTTCNTSSCDPTFLLGSLALGNTHSYSLYLAGGNQVQVNWAINESLPPFVGWCLLWFGTCPACPYNCGGSVWMVDPNGSEISGTRVSGNSSTATLTLNLSWSVPAGTSGNYTIYFQNTNTYRYLTNNPCFCTCTTNQTVAYTAFSGTGETDHTWVAVGKPVGGQVYSYQDYVITANTTRTGTSQKILSISAVVRGSPGPLAWWQEQTVEIPSWQIKYYY